MFDIKSKLNELECKCVKKHGADKCYKIADRVMIAIIVIPVLFYALMMYLFTDFTLKFTLSVLLIALAIIAVLLIKDLIFYAIKFLIRAKKWKLRT